MTGKVFSSEDIDKIYSDVVGMPKFTPPSDPEATKREMWDQLEYYWVDYKAPPTELTDSTVAADLKSDLKKVATAAKRLNQLLSQDDVYAKLAGTFPPLLKHDVITPEWASEHPEPSESVHGRLSDRLQPDAPSLAILKAGLLQLEGVADWKAKTSTGTQLLIGKYRMTQYQMFLLHLGVVYEDVFRRKLTRTPTGQSAYFSCFMESVFETRGATEGVYKPGSLMARYCEAADPKPRKRKLKR